MRGSRGCMTDGQYVEFELALRIVGPTRVAKLVSPSVPGDVDEPSHCKLSIEECKLKID